ncbi:MAG TPA: DUF305 domain-containing protein [Gemmatimonadales bacterium]|jgi:uncharacterized protein (DUF305 family)|nr:DUF305 domain-containing protein [Gemmatimonadales bacterium]
MIGITPLPTRRIAALLAAGTLACGSATRGPVGTAPQPGSPGPVLLSGVAKASADSARYPYTEADIRFMSGMIAHHAQAIVMAGWAPSHGAGPSVRTLCERIINAQTDEIALMQQWLRDRLQPAPEASPKGMKMMMNGVEHEMLMPGMLSEAQMQQLDQARGTEFDRLFLVFMIQHHQGAITMVKELFDTYGAGQDNLVFKFASDVNIDQTTEIARMEKILTAVITTPQ